MNILAIDPAQRTGFAHSVGIHGVWKLGATPGLRCSTLAAKIEEVVRKYRTDVIAYEAATFGSHNIHAQRRHNELAGVIEGTAAKLGLPCWNYNPGQWKAIALGKGNLDKPGVMRMLRLAYEIDVQDEDIADALGILKAAEKGPPPEPKKKAMRRLVKELSKRQARLFR